MISLFKYKYKIIIVLIIKLTPLKKFHYFIILYNSKKLILILALLKIKIISFLENYFLLKIKINNK